jgi:glycine oxidase
MSEVVVVGAGIIGLSIAWGLRQRGVEVAVYDPAGPATGASGVAAGMLAPLCEAPDLPPPVLRLGLESLAAWPAFAGALEAASGRSVDLRAGGTLLVAMDHDELGELDQAARLLSAMGLRYEPLSPRELRRAAPALHPRVVGGYRAPDDGGVDAQAVCAALVAALAARGVEVRREAVRAVAADGVDTDGGRVAAERVVVAAGAWSQALVPSVRVVPVKGQVVVLEGEDLLPCVVRTPRVYLVPRVGRLVVGASMEEQGFDTRPTAGIVMNLLREAFRVLPGSFELSIAGLRTGLRPMLAHGRPVIGPVGGIVVATGHHRHGVLLAPGTAEIVARGVLDGEWDSDFVP